MGAIQPMKIEGYPAHQNWGQSSPWKLRAIQPMIVGSPAMLRGLSPKGLSSPSCKHQNHVSCVPCVCVLVCSNFNRIFNRIFNRFFNIRLFFFNRFFNRKLNIQLAKLLKKINLQSEIEDWIFSIERLNFSIEDALGHHGLLARTVQTRLYDSWSGWEKGQSFFCFLFLSNIGFLTRHEPHGLPDHSSPFCRIRMTFVKAIINLTPQRKCETCMIFKQSRVGGKVKTWL